MRSTYHLLYVEDDEAEIATFRRLYEGDLFEVTPVCIQFPRSALPKIEQALGSRVPDLFVLDLFFPVTSAPPSGFTADTVDEARLIHQKYPGVPVVFYSRKAMVADLKAALQAGALDVIPKPHRSLEDVEAVRIRDALAACCEGRPPGWRRPPV